MKNLAGLLLLLFIGVGIFGQEGNPFDKPGLESHSGVSEVFENSSNSDSSEMDNPFNIKSKREGSENFKRTPQSIPLKGNALEESQLIVLIYVLVMLIILTLAISMNRRRFKSMLRALINSNQLRTLYRDGKVWTGGQSVLLYIFFFMNLSFALWIWSMRSAFTEPLNLFSIGGLLIAIYVVRHLMMWILSVIYPIGIEMDMHNYSIALHNKILGVSLVPIILALEFLPDQMTTILSWIFFGLIIVFYLLRQSKSLLLALGIRALNPFYFFIYLCAVEIAPMLVIYKLLMGAL